MCFLWPFHPLLVGTILTLCRGLLLFLACAGPFTVCPFDEVVEGGKGNISLGFPAPGPIICGLFRWFHDTFGGIGQSFPVLVPSSFPGGQGFQSRPLSLACIGVGCFQHGENDISSVGVLLLPGSEKGLGRALVLPQSF